MNFLNGKILVFSWTVVIVVLSFIKLPPSQGEAIIPHLDKLVHLGLYLVLGFALSKTEWKTAVVFGYVFVLGGGIEILQKTITTYRSGDIWDFCCDILGAVIGLYHYKLINIIK